MYVITLVYISRGCKLEVVAGLKRHVCVYVICMCVCMLHSTSMHSCKMSVSVHALVQACVVDIEGVRARLNACAMACVKTDQSCAVSAL